MKLGEPGGYSRLGDGYTEKDDNDNDGDVRITGDDVRSILFIETIP